MGLLESLVQGGAIDSMAGELGIPPAMARAGAAALLPAILGGFQKTAAPAPQQAESPLGSLIGALGGGGLLESVLAPQATPVQQGNDILGTIFGSKDVSRTVAAHGEAQSGVSGELLKKMLPILAMAVAGYLAKQAGGAGAGGAAANTGGGGLGGMLGQILGGAMGGGGAGGQQAGGGALGGLGSLIDMNGDGNPLDDIISMAGKMMR